MSALGVIATGAFFSALLTLPLLGLLALFGRRGLLTAAVWLVGVTAINWWVASKLEDQEFGGLGALIAFFDVILSPAFVVIGWHIGEAYRSRKLT